jgi:hypothetical protein
VARWATPSSAAYPHLPRGVPSSVCHCSLAHSRLSISPSLLAFILLTFSRRLCFSTVSLASSFRRRSSLLRLAFPLYLCSSHFLNSYCPGRCQASWGFLLMLGPNPGVPAGELRLKPGEFAFDVFLPSLGSCKILLRAFYFSLCVEKGSFSLLLSSLLLVCCWQPFTQSRLWPSAFPFSSILLSSSCYREISPFAMYFRSMDRALGRRSRPNHNVRREQHASTRSCKTLATSNLDCLSSVTTASFQTIETHTRSICHAHEVD